MRGPTRAEIEGARNTRAQLAQWGIPWPPPRGWRKRLLREADRASGTGTRPRQLKIADENPTGRIRVGPYRVGEQHRAWPEWTWNGRAFVRSDRWNADRIETQGGQDR